MIGKCREISCSAVPAMLFVAFAASAPCAWGDEQVQVDAKVPPYKVVSGISGSMSSVGSDTLNNLMTFWSEKFNKFYPNVKIQVEGKGSSTAPPAAPPPVAPHTGPAPAAPTRP